MVLAVMNILVFADGAVLQTGQVKSYNANGDVVTDGSVKDDGYYRAGQARSYSRLCLSCTDCDYPSRILDFVIDSVTGLDWQDDESTQKPWDTQENHDGNNNDTSDDTATTYCAGLLIDGVGGWRLPSIVELGTLVDYTRSPTVTEGVFNHIVANSYWSSTAYVQYDTDAWSINFNLGDSMAQIKSTIKNVRCVRGGQLPSSNLSRDDEEEIVTDSMTGLQWQDDNTAGSKLASWTEAIDYCENTLILGGYNDWRLPNINELNSIIDYTRYDPALNISKFENYSASPTYWSSTSSYGGGLDRAWTVFFRDGYSYFDQKSGASGIYVRCVRGGQTNIVTPVNPSIIMYLLN